MLFIGYSLQDYIQRLLFMTLRWRIDASNWPPAFSVDPYPDPQIREVWDRQRRLLSFIVTDVRDFVSQLYSLVTKEEMPS